MNRFIGREKELKALRQGALSNRGILVFGPRQVGKSRLIAEAFSTDDFLLIYHECIKGSFAYNTELLARSVANATGISYASGIRDLFDLLSILESVRTGARIVVAIDEYQYLRETEGGGVIDSYMQRFIDSIKGNITLLLCGSYITVMKELLEYGNPLFSRLKTVIELSPFNYLESSLFYPSLSVRDKIAFYAVFGGYPFILERVDERVSLEENIKRLFIDPYSGVRFAIENVLLQEVGRTGMPFEVLAKIGNAKRRFNELCDAMAEDVKGTLDRIIKRLIAMKILEKVSPINRKDDKRKTFYEIKDNLIRFYFAYVYPLRTVPSRHSPDAIFDAFIRPSIETYISKRFEIQAREYFSLLGNLDIKAIGSYWHDDPDVHKNEEFDCAISRNGEYCLYEVKYLSAPMPKELYDAELEKMKASSLRALHFGFVSASGFSFPLDKDYDFITGDMMYNI